MLNSLCKPASAELFLCLMSCAHCEQYCQEREPDKLSLMLPTVPWIYWPGRVAQPLDTDQLWDVFFPKVLECSLLLASGFHAFYDWGFFPTTYLLSYSEIYTKILCADKIIFSFNLEKEFFLLLFDFVFFRTNGWPAFWWLCSYRHE